MYSERKTIMISIHKMSYFRTLLTEKEKILIAKKLIHSCTRFKTS